MGTTGLAVTIGLANEFLKPRVRALLSRRSKEVEAKPPRRDFLASAALTAVTWIVLFCAGIIATVYRDHQDLVAQNRNLSSLQAENEQLSRRVKELTPTEEPKDSLRRRTLRLADELYNFLLDRQQHHPPIAYPNSSDPNPSEERKQAIKLCQEYDQATLETYRKRFRDRLVGIVREYHAKGIPVGFLENSARQQIPGWQVVGAEWEGWPMDELTLFRNLAYRVDEHDNAIYLMPRPDP